jgi:hypothetical protein|eukprot:7390996-Prymnesium_polylepis.1
MALTLSSAERRIAGIPDLATHCAFAYPLEMFHDKERAQKVLEIEKTLTRRSSTSSPPEEDGLEDTEKESKASWATFCVNGGFAYFTQDEAAADDSLGRLLQVSALSLERFCAHKYRVEGPFKADRRAIVYLREAGRLKRITADMINGADISSFTKFAWVNPGEDFDAKGEGTRLALGEELYSHGALVYTGDGEAVQPIYYAIAGKKVAESGKSIEGQIRELRAEMSKAESVTPNSAMRRQSAIKDASMKSHDRKVKHQPAGQPEKIGARPMLQLHGSQSLFNAHSTDRVSKPTRLYVLDVMARAQRYAEIGVTKKTLTGWVPSGPWRVFWKLMLLLLSTVEVTISIASLSFCHCPMGVTSSASSWSAAFYWLVQCVFAIDMLMTVSCTAYVPLL